jgi:hypothetical protein
MPEELRIKNGNGHDYFSNYNLIHKLRQSPHSMLSQSPNQSATSKDSKDPNQIAECGILLIKYINMLDIITLNFNMSKITYHHHLFLLYHLWLGVAEKGALSNQDAYW